MHSFQKALAGCLSAAILFAGYFLLPLTPKVQAASGALEYAGYNIGQATSTGEYDPVDIGVNQTLEYIFEPDSGGTVAYIQRSAGGSTDGYRLELATPYDISSYTSRTSYDTPVNTTDVLYNNDGSKVYYTSYVTNRIAEYDLTTNYDLTTGTFVDEFDYDVIAGEIDVYSSDFNADGTKLFVTGEDTDAIYEFDLSPAYDVSTAVASGVTLDLTPFYTASGTGANNNNVRGTTFGQDGQRLYIVNDVLSGPTYDVLIEVALTTPYDLTTAAYVSHLNVSGVSPIVSLSGVSFDDNGQNMFLSSVGGEIYGFDTNQGYNENVANDGSLDNSSPLIITLTGDTFQDTDADDLLDIGTEVVITGVPPGLTPALALTGGDSVATLTFTGNAIDNQDVDDVDNLTFVFDDTAFTGGMSAMITNSGNGGAYSSNVGIDFEDNPQVSGTVYTDEGVTNIGAGKTVTLLINGALADCGGGAGSCQADTDANGFYIIQGTDVDAITAGDLLTVFIDDETEQGVAVTAAEDESQTGFDIYQNYLIVREDNGGTMTNAILASATNADADIDAIYTVAGGNLTTTSGTELYLWRGDDFTPGGSVFAGGTIDINGTLAIETNFVSIAGDLDVNSLGGSLSSSTGSAITMNGTTAQSFNQGTATQLSDVTISNTTDVVTVIENRFNISSNDLTIDAGATFNIGDLTSVIASGTFSNEGTIQLNGRQIIVSITQDTDSGTWEFVDDGDNSAENIAIDGTPFPSTYYNLTINSNDVDSGDRDIFTVSTTGLTVNNDLTVTSGTFSTGSQTLDIDGNYTQGVDGLFSGNSSTITIAGNFTNDAGVGFSAGTSTVEFDANTDHIIAGNTVFNNLTYQQTSDDTAGNTLTFGDSATYIISSNLVLNGLDADDQIAITSSAPGTAATLNVLGGSAAITADYLTISDNTLQDNGVTMDPALDPANSTNAGNAAGWFTGISGTVYTDEGVTNIGAGKTVTLLINGALADCGGGAGSCQADTDANGVYLIEGTDVDSLAGGEVLTVFIDDETENGVSVTIASGPGPGDFDIYQNYLITRHDNGGSSLTNANLATADDTDPGTSTDDISSIYTLDGSNNLTTPAGVELLVWTGDVYAPGANLDLAGNLDVDGSIDITTNAVNLAGNLDVSGGFSSNIGSVITMDGTSAQLFNQGANTLNSDLVIANTAATVSLDTNPLNLLANDLTIDAGAILVLDGLNIDQVTGAFDNNGTLQVNGQETTINMTQDITGGTWEFVDDGDATAETVVLDGAPFPDSYYNLIINSNDATPANRDTYQKGTTTLTLQNDFTITSGTYDTNNQWLTVNGDFLLDTNGVFNGTTGFLTFIGNFTNRAGTGFTPGTTQTTMSQNVDHTIIGDTTFYGFVYQNTVDNSTNGTLTFGAGDTFTFNDALILNGRDADDQILIISDTPGTAAVFNVAGGASDVTADYLTVTDNTLQDNGATMNPELDPADSLDGGNTLGWFSAAKVEFSAASASSTDESVADNFPVLFINGVTTASATVDVDITGGTATGTGTDYTQSDPVTVTIPAGTYDGTTGTAITITAPTLNDDSIIEGAETITYSLTNFSTAEIASGDADGDTTSQDSHTYSITDDDGLSVQFSAATQSSPEATGTAPTVVVSGAQLLSATTVEVALTASTATGGGTDYTFTSPQTLTIPAADYTSGGTLSITGLTIVDEATIEADETIDFLLQNPSADVTVGTQSTTVYTITNDDSATVSISVTDATAAENPNDNGQYTVTMSQTNSTGSAITVNYGVSGTATAGSDYLALSGSVTIADSASTGIITLDTTGFDDALVESGETVIITLTGTDNTDVTLGATTSATITITDDEDEDGDGVSSAIEDAGFNTGDGNGDGIADSLQSEVTGINNPVTSGYTTIEVSGGACNVISNASGLAEESLADSDTTYDYPVGLIEFLIECANPGDTATITFYYDQVYDTSDWEFRKYNDKTGTFEDIDATVTVTLAPFTLPNGGQTVTSVSYDVTDGSNLDTDANPPLTDRFIYDPAGPGTPVVVASSSSGGVSGGRRICKDPDAINYDATNRGRHVQSVCQYPDETDILDTIEDMTGLTCPVFTEYARIGDRGAGVEAAQIFFEMKGYYNGPIDGVFDTGTRQAVTDFQNDNWERILKPWGIEQGRGTGWLYQSTRAHMNVLSGCDVCVTLDNGQKVGCDEEVPAPEPALDTTLELAECPHFTQYYQDGDEGGEISKIQAFLRGQGFNPGPLDGIMGGQTIEAIKRFQAKFTEIILQPWGHSIPTGRWYQTTRRHANELAGCETDTSLELDNGVVIE